MGWMTLHSVSSLYPEQPSPSERKLMETWLYMFRDTITCHHCKSHFTDMLEIYQRKFPMILASRREFMAFAFRAHNTVNRRLHKPLYTSVDECMTTLRKNVETRTAAEYRSAYLTHIRKYWSTFRDMSGIAALRKIVEMIKVENDYFRTLDKNFDISVEPIEVLLPYGVLEKVEESVFVKPRYTKAPPQPQPAVQQTSEPQPERRLLRAGFQVTRNGIRLR